jgi:hypothetical protein
MRYSRKMYSRKEMDDRSMCGREISSNARNTESGTRKEEVVSSERGKRGESK